MLTRFVAGPVRNRKQRNVQAATGLVSCGKCDKPVGEVFDKYAFEDGKAHPVCLCAACFMAPRDDMKLGTVLSGVGCSRVVLVGMYSDGTKQGKRLGMDRIMSGCARGPGSMTTAGRVLHPVLL